MPFENGKFVLVLDDEPIIIKVFERVFENQSYALLDVATTVEEALQKLQFVIYDFIFLDMRIDGDSSAGMRVLRMLNRLLIKSRSEARSTMNSKVIIMSSSVSLQDIMLEANALKVVTFLTKPVNFSEEYLLDIVQLLGLPLLPRQTKAT